jgi:hypothetical protein
MMESESMELGPRQPQAFYIITILRAAHVVAAEVSQVAPPLAKGGAPAALTGVSYHTRQANR